MESSTATVAPPAAPHRTPPAAADPAAALPAAAARRALVAALMAVLLIATGRNFAVIAQLVTSAPRPAQWDMAHRAVDGVRLAAALRQGDLAQALWQVNEMGVWPPVFPLFEAPAFLLFGYDYRVPRLLVSVLFLLSIPAIFWAGRHLDPRRGQMVGLLAAALLCASPFFHLFATLVMLEVPGALLLILSLGAYVRALESADPGRWRLAWGLATVLFFCKFNYALMWLAPVLLVEVWRLGGSWSAVAGRLRQRLSAVDLKNPWNRLLLLYGAVVGTVLLAGGLKTEIAGVGLSITSVGNPVYHLYLLFALRYLARPRHHLGRFRSWLGGLAPRHQQLVRWAVVPIAIWMLVPPHLRDFFDFVQNRSSDMAFLSAENLLFYPRVLARQFAPPSWPGAVLLALAFLPCLALTRLSWRQRTLALALLCGSAAIVIHPYKLPRFAFTVAPLVWLSAALAMAYALTWVSERLVAPPRRRLLALFLAGAVTVATVAPGVDQRGLGAGYAVRTVPRAVEPVLEAVRKAAYRDRNTAILGTWNLLSPWLVEWHLRQRDPALDPERIPRNVRFGRVRPAEICTTLAASQVIALDPLPSARAKARPAARGFAEEIAPLGPLYGALAAAPCFRQRSERAFPHAGYRLRIYQRQRSP